MNIFHNTLKKILSNDLTIAVIGLGYVGLPISLKFAKKKIKVIGIDTDREKIKKLKICKSYIDRISDKDIYKVKNYLKASSSYSDISIADVILIAVPTPLKKNKPNLEYLKKTIVNVKKYLKIGQLIILESTSYPGTTREEIVEKIFSKFNVGKDFFVSFSSERINPGQNEKTINLVPKVVSGYSKNCLKLSQLFYYKFFNKVVTAKSLEVAEFSKLHENIYRAVNIALVNEMKNVSDKMNINFNDVVEAAATKPYGFQKFYPGPGIGGHCIPIDPIYLSWKANKLGIKTEFIKLAAKINQDTTKKIISTILKYLKKLKVSKKNQNVLILGLSYKKNIDDLRESPSLKIIQHLRRKKVKVTFSDPYFEKIPKTREFGYNIKKLKINKQNIKKNQLVVLVTDHDQFDFRKILKFSKKIIDCRNVFPYENKKILRLD